MVNYELQHKKSIPNPFEGKKESLFKNIQAILLFNFEFP